MFDIPYAGEFGAVRSALILRGGVVVADVARKPAKPRHGTARRYKDGCRCDRCRAKNTADRRRERERANARAGNPVPTARKRVPTVRFVPTPAPADVPTKGSPVDLSSVRGTLEAALAEVAADDLIALHRKAHALRLASVLDDVSKPHLWRGITTSLNDVLALLVANKPPTDAEGDALAAFMAKIGSSRGRGRGAAQVDDTAEPKP